MLTGLSEWDGPVSFWRQRFLSAQNFSIDETAIMEVCKIFLLHAIENAQQAHSSHSPSRTHLRPHSASGSPVSLQLAAGIFNSISTMKVIRVIEDEEVVKKTLNHLGLWDVRTRSLSKDTTPPETLENSNSHKGFTSLLLMTNRQSSTLLLQFVVER